MIIINALFTKYLIDKYRETINRGLIKLERFRSENDSPKTGVDIELIVVEVLIIYTNTFYTFLRFNISDHGI